MRDRVKVSADHGTTAGYYRHRRQGQPTCEPCKAAVAAYQRAKTDERGKRPDLPHGTASGFVNWGCRCQECRDAHYATKNEQRRTRRKAGSPE